MLKQSVRKMKIRAVVCFVEIILAAALVMSGCATSEKIQPPLDQAGASKARTLPAEDRQITDVRTEETADAIVISIQANHVLDYTLAEPPLQQAKVLYFPDSGLSLSQTEFPVENEIVGTIEAVELVKGGPSKIVIPIKSPEVACEAHRGDDDNILEVVFPRAAGDELARTETMAEDVIDVIAEETVQPEETVYEEAAYYEPMERDLPVKEATRLEDIDVMDEADLISVKIKADGTIKTHKSFTLKNPPRIVIDMAGLGSPYKKEQRLAVNSDIVQQVRHCGHTGYLRVVLDVDQTYLSDFKVSSVPDGLMVYVGNIAGITSEITAPESRWASAETDELDETAQVEEMPPEDVYTPPVSVGKAYVEPTAEDIYAEPEAADEAYKLPAQPDEDSLQLVEEDIDIIGDYDRPALVNRVDFIDEQGKSTICIGTTHPVKYKVFDTGEKQVRLTLEKADILSFRQRPLITTRFESAINSIIPLQTQAMKQKGLSVIDINLRENVGYTTERQDNQILVHFEPSSVPPDPALEVVIPTEASLVQEPEWPTEETMTTTAEVMPGETEALPGEDGWADEEPGVLAAETGEPMSQELPELLAGKQKVYTGEPIALEFYKTDIRNVVRILKDVSGKNFAIDENVSGSVTLSFVNPVPWDQVLDLVLEMNNLGMVEQGGIIRVSTKDTILKQKEAARAAMAAEQELKITEEQLAPLVTEYFSINYSDASQDILPHIQDILTEDRGHAKVDSRTNQLIMTDIQDKVDMAREIIERIDMVTPQVMINARIVETSSSFSKEFGTEWGVNNSPGTYRPEIGGTYDYGVAMNNPAASATNTLGLNFSRIVGTPFSLDAKLSLMESVGEVRIISSPRVVTLDNKKAAISQGQEIPYTSVDDGEVDTLFKDADLKLEVTPHVTPDNRISMKIHIEEKEVGEQGALDEPPLNTKEADTELLVNDGDTIVIGGIIQETEREGWSGIPILSRIPLLGHLFKQQSRSNEKSELLIFITPTIVRLD